MKFDSKLLVRVFSPRIIGKAMQAFDRSTVIVVASCWAAAMFMIGFALYTLHLTVVTKSMAEEVLVAEPSLPKIVRDHIEERAAQALTERLQHQYPNISITYRGNPTLTAADGSRFHEWLQALGYIDTISPQYHWAIQELCVGNCNSHDLMKAVLIGEKITFKKPEPEVKD